MGDTLSVLCQDEQQTYQRATHWTTGAVAKCEGVSLINFADSFMLA